MWFLHFLIFLIIWRFWLWFSQNNTFFQYNMNRHIEKHGFLQSNQWKLWNFHCKRKPRHQNIEISLCLQWTFSDFDSFDNGKSWFSYVLFIFHWKYVCFERNHSQNLHIIKNFKNCKDLHFKIFNKPLILSKILKI